MNHIGNVIMNIRCNIGMSRKELVDNICTEKYLYLIEKGQRTPSTEILRLLSNKLGADLFKYYEYLDCINPIQVYDAIKQCNTFRRFSDFESLNKFNNEMIHFPDFNTEPWKYEVDVNRFSYMVFVEHKFNIAINDIEDLLSNMDMKYYEEECTANLYLILSTCYQILKDITNAKKALSSAYQIVSNKLNIAGYSQVIVSTKLNTMTLCHLCGEYDTAIDEGLWLYQNKLRSVICERNNYMFYYLAYSYYKKGMYEDAFLWFEKCLYDLLIYNNQTAAYYISNYDLFYNFLNDERLCPELIYKIKKNYSFISYYH